ncbi:MAG: hypothetical protein LVS60_09470 [Nodosilinea sp. LVE1205-7]
MPWLGVGDRAPWKVRLKAVAGPLFNLLGLGLGLWAGVHGLRVGLLGLGLAGYGFALANGVLLITSQSDWLSLVSGQGDRLYCGNFGFISQGEGAKAGDLIL